MRSIFTLCLPAIALAGGSPAWAEAPLAAWLEQEGAGWLYLHTTTDVGRGYQVESSPSLAAVDWSPALAQPAEGNGGRLAFYLGQRPEFDGAPPVHPPRRDFTMLAFADGTALAQWVGADGIMIRRRLPLDFRQVPRLANAVTTTSTVVTRTQLAVDAPSLAVAEAPEPDPEVRAALEALVDAYPLLQFATPETVVRATAETGQLVATRFWRVRRVERDSDTDGLSDYDEWNARFTNPLASDSDGDGVSDSGEVAAGTAPMDYFNGMRPTLVRAPSRWGDVPYTGPNEWLSEPLVLEVRSPGGTLLANAPVTACTDGGNLDLWHLPLAVRSPQPVISTRSDAQGRVALAWRSDGQVGSATLVHAWTGEGVDYQGTHFLVHTLRALPPPGPTVLAWLKSDAEVQATADGRVERWSDLARSVIATADGSRRPMLQTSGPLPLLQFDGSHRLDLGAARGGASMSALMVAQPSTTRTQPPVNAANPANRTPGLTGQRYLLAGDVATTASPWLYTPPVPRKLATTQYFSRYVAQFFTVDLVNDIRGYNCREITYNFGFLLPSLPAAQVPSVRYDVTSGAIADPGPVNRQRGKTYRLNPNLPNCPLKAGASLATCLADFVPRRGLPASYEWETRQLATYTRRVGNPLTDDFSEIYYEAKGFSPEVPEEFVLQPGSIGTLGQGISVATNSAGYFHLAQSFAPSLGTAPTPTPSALALTSVVITNGRPSFFMNGTAAGSSTAPAGGAATGIRHLGALASGTNGFAGTVADIILTSDPLTDETRRSLEDLLADRHRSTKVDREADGLPDWWERRCLATGTASTPAGNPDSDGLTNTQERARFTLPERADSDRDGLTDGAESAAAAVTADTDSDGFLDGTDTTPSDPANGRADANGDGIPDGLASLLASPDQRDSDGDTLSDLVESVTTRTNPLTPDTDADSLPDAWESAFLLDPNDPSGANGPTGDPDRDGKSNAEERAVGTNPQVAD